MPKGLITLTVNGEVHNIAVEPQWTLAEVLREHLHLTGVKIGCDHGDCGACTVLIDGKPVLSCITLAITVEGCSIQTIEGLSVNGQLDPLQKSFLEHSATQCGFCTPGMILTSKALIEEHQELTEEQLREGLSGNLCRCTGYTKIIDAVKSVADEIPVAEKNPAMKIDGTPQVTGSAKYTDDFFLPRMLFGKILRSPHAHANIITIDTSKAERLPGVIAVMTGRELPAKYGVLPASQDETALCIDKVRFIGDGVAAVAAVDEQTAQEALSLIDVQYEILPAVLSVDDALRSDLPKIHEGTKYENNAAKHAELEFGNVEQGFAEADYIREDKFYYGPSTHAMLEPHSALASFEPPKESNDYKDGYLTLWSSTQAPHYVHRTLAKVLDIPASRVRIIKPYLGGGFGGKAEPFALEFCAAWLSIKSGRPVKITYTREEVFYSHRGRHGTSMWLKTGVKKDGTITAIEYKAQLDGGAYGSYGVVTSYYTAQFLTLPYKTPAFKFDSTRFYTNKPPAGPKRGHGAVQPRFAFEAQLDRIAEHLGIDPADIRLKNLVEPNSMTINSLRVTSCGMKDCIDAVTKASGWREKRGALSNARGIGIAASSYISGAGKEIHWHGLPHSGAIVKIDRGGGVTVFCGSSDIGQGSNTALANLVSVTLGISIGDVKVYEADTDLTPVDLGSYSSRVTFMAGNAVLHASRDLKGKLFNACAEKLQCHLEDLLAADGKIICTGDASKFVVFSEAAKLAEAKFGTLAAAGWYAPPKLGGTYKGAGAGPSPSYSFTAHVVELEVDTDTGAVKIHNVWSAHDCGKALNRKMVEGQIEGSVYMGIGEALSEEMVYAKGTSPTDGNSEICPPGLMKNPSLLEYKIPTILDTPPIKTFIIESNDPEGPLGAKEAGEGPLLGVAAAIVNAIYDAIGVRMSSIPCTPEDILAAIREKHQSVKSKNVKAATGVEVPAK
ncbi:MAG: molybdopterin-dependent oxidoreductase [Bacteroidota bacterium]